MRIRMCAAYAACTILAASTAGCSQPKIVDDLRILHAFGVDRQDSEYRASGLYLDYNKTAKIAMTQGRGDTTELLLADMNMQSPKPIQTGKLRLLVFSRRMAEAGVGHFIHTFCRNPVISTTMIVAITEEAPEKIFERSLGKSSDVMPYYIIKQNIKTGNAPITNLQIFLYNYYGKGRDPFVPYLAQNEKGEIKIKGFGIFRQDRLKLIIDAKETLLFKLLKGWRVEGGILPFPVDPEQPDTPAVFTVLRGHVRLVRSRETAGTVMTFNVNLVGMVKEMPAGSNLRKQDIYRNVTREVESQINAEAEKLLAKFQAGGVDPLGIGDQSRARTRGKWSEDEFYKTEYPNMRMKVKTHIVLKESGIGN